MKPTNKLPSFTILEVLINLIIIGIIINLAYAIYTLMSKQMISYEKQNTELLDYNLLNSTLRRDFANANQVYFEDDVLVLSFYNTEEVKYTIHKNHLIMNRKHMIDTLNLNIIEHHLNTGINQTSYEVKMVLLNQPLTLHYYKKKPIANFINQSFLHEDRN